VAIGTDLDVKKDVLGIWLGADESSKYWLSLTSLNSIKSHFYILTGPIINVIGSELVFI
jgi:hypothetical protein